ncbi:phage tail tape measure protein [Anaerotruncus sp. DFI.9.16]|uniref:phage tail tape measure protein n=1 Tax=Anaerotruncus sp. DFI.9.16 TaxID=2965275 RepID=UPI00210BFDBD|nr:phage tail tape measure protein [Anaerotruncus sp. DFI.9.16]MCQ4895965.1 phage tail tape measure protein [Anaerotruncus sp. DFI.9.16]
MAGRKEYEMLFQLNAQLGGSYSKTFKAAQQEIVSMQKEIQALSKTQADISAFQKQQAAVEATRKRLEMLRQQYDNIQREMEETGNESADMKNKLLAKQLQIDKTSASLEKQTAKLNELSGALEEAGVNTDDLSHSSEQLAGKIDTLKKKQGEAADKAMTFGDKAGQAFNQVHEAIVAAGIAVALKEIYEYFASCAQASMDFESAITGVAKTTDLTDEELAAMSDSIKALSTEIPATTEEIAAVAEAAGQLGIQKDALLDFTEIMTMLGTATNMTADEAATALARFANITGMATDNYGRLGSVIVDLGNNFATTESEIVAMGTRLASAGKLAGLTEPEIMALAAAMSSVGIEAEAGGTAMTQTLNAIEKAVAKGGDDLAEFARIAGMSSEEFSSAWKNDAMSALTSFIGGLGKLDEQGESTVLVLEDLGLTGIRQSNMLKALGLAADQMTGAVNTANTAWQQNTALTNEANKRYATAQSRLTMMQNAYNNLKVAIGDAYTPALSEAYGVGTKVLNEITKFVQANPGVVAAITGLSAALGAAAVAAAAFALKAKIAAAAAAFLTTVTPGVNVIMGVAAAVGVVTAGIIALASSAANDAVPSVKELTEAARGMREAMDEAKATYDDTVTSTMAAAGVADTYIGKLEELEAAGLNTDEQHRQYHNTLALLCQVVPELADYIDLETDTINGGTEALRANTEAWKQNAMQQAYQDQLTELYSQYSAVLIEAEENSIGLTKAQYSLEAAQQKLSDTYAQMDALWADAQKQADAYYDQYGYYTDATAFLSQEYYDLQNSIYDTNNEIWAAEKSIKNYNKAMEEDADAVSDAEAEIALAEEAVKNLTASMNEGTGASEEAAAQVSEFQAAISGVQEKINALVESYNEAYSAAYESISGQYQLWDEAAKVVATSAGSINSALESQITYWQDYNANLQSLTDRSADIEGLSDMIASFADGSSDSVNAIAGMAGATDEQLATMVANWKTLQQEQQNAAGSVADLKTDFTAAMDELQTALAEDIEAMDLGDEAKASAQATIQGFIDGAVGMLPQVTAAYNRVAAAARAALSASGTGTAGSIPGYAVGTQSAAPGFALVGENGPELVYFNGGEQVMTAEETAAMRESMEIQAITFAPQLLEALHAIHGDGALSAEPGAGSGAGSVELQIVFQINGGASPETVEALREYGDEFAERVLEVMEEAGIDTARRAYK